MYKDLREYIAILDQQNLLRRVSSVSPETDIGEITELLAATNNEKAVLFEDFGPQYIESRVLTNLVNTPARASLALGMDVPETALDALRAWKSRRSTIKPIEAIVIDKAPFLDHVVKGENVDLGRFPVPVWHPQDGGPYIGSGALVITGDPESSWVNASIYRVQVHGKNFVTVQFDHKGRHGALIAEKFWKRNEPCPVSIVIGQDPALFISGFEYLKEGASEYAFAGGIKGQPIETYRMPVSGNTVPAHSEIVLDGFLHPPSDVVPLEGPFGEFTGYYAADKKPAPYMIVEELYYRDNPIIFGSPPLKPPAFHFGLPFRAAGIWDTLEAAGVTDVKGVWQHVSQLMTVVSLAQRYPGHSKRAGLIAAAQSYMGRIIVTVDEDVDVTNLADVMWAISTRSEPSEDFDIIRNAWSSSLDPGIAKHDRDIGNTVNSKVIIDACIPLHAKAAFPKTTAMTPQERNQAHRRWKDRLDL